MKYLKKVQGNEYFIGEAIEMISIINQYVQEISNSNIKL